MPKSARKLDGTCIRIKKVRNANKHTTLPEKKYLMFVGLDVHKNSVQVAAVDEIGKLLFNKKISSDFSAISKITSKIPKNAKYVLESSSVWYGLYRHMTDKLHLDVILSNPYNTKIIASSLKKTDKIDAYHLANLLRGGLHCRIICARSHNCAIQTACKTSTQDCAHHCKDEEFHTWYYTTGGNPYQSNTIFLRTHTCTWKIGEL